MGVPPATLRGALEPWCAVGATGALRVEDPPGGAIFIVDGRLSYAECGLVTGVDKLLTASGRVPADVWRAAVASGRATGRIGDTLVADGYISRNELALSALSALMDAAFFLFDAAVTAQFEPDAVNPLGTFCELEFAEVCAEVDRRRRLLADVWPDPAIDTAAVVPARRLRGHQVSLTAAQWEIVANADRRRSPTDLARLLGRETFVMLLEARRLARSGLIEPGRPGGSAVAESVAAVRARTAAAMVRATSDHRSPTYPSEGGQSTDGQSADGRSADPPSPDRRSVDRASAGLPPVDRASAGAPPVDRASVDRASGDRQPGDRQPGDRRVPDQRVDSRSAGPARGSAAVPAGAVPATSGVGLSSVTLPVRTPADDPDETRGLDVPLPRRRTGGTGGTGEPRRWPADPAVERPVEECSESTLMRIQRALRALR